MKNFLVLTIFLMLGAYGRVVAQDAAAASKRANQQYVLFESERDKGTNVTGMRWILRQLILRCPG